MSARNFKWFRKRRSTHDVHSRDPYKYKRDVDLLWKRDVDTQRDLLWIAVRLRRTARPSTHDPHIRDPYQYTRDVDTRVVLWTAVLLRRTARPSTHDPHIFGNLQMRCALQLPYTRVIDSLSHVWLCTDVYLLSEMAAWRAQEQISLVLAMFIYMDVYIYTYTNM